MKRVNEFFVTFTEDDKLPEYLQTTNLPINAEEMVTLENGHKVFRSHKIGYECSIFGKQLKNLVKYVVFDPSAPLNGEQLLLKDIVLETINRKDMFDNFGSLTTLFMNPPYGEMGRYYAIFYTDKKNHDISARRYMLLLLEAYCGLTKEDIIKAAGPGNKIYNDLISDINYY